MTGNVARKGRWQLLTVAAVFFVPFILAWLMYFDVISWRPTANAANGELFEPPVMLASEAPEYLARVYDTDFLKTRWTLVFVSADSCNTDCQQALLTMRQVRSSLGRYADRIGRAMLVSRDGAFLDDLYKAFPNMEIVKAETLGRSILNSHAAQPGDWIYLVDPLGNLVLRFSIDQNPRAMYVDLKRLLKLSRIG